MQSGISQQKNFHKLNCTLDLDKLSSLFPSCTLPSFSVAVYSINKQSNHTSYRNCHLWLSNSKKSIRPGLSDSLELIAAHWTILRRSLLVESDRALVPLRTPAAEDSATARSFGADNSPCLLLLRADRYRAMR